MLETIVWGGVGIFCGVAGASFVQGFMEARKRRQNAPKQTPLEHALAASNSNHDTQPELMVKLLPATNGRLLEISTKRPHPMHHGHFDWEHEMFIVEEGQTLSQAIAMVMLMKGLEK